MMIASTTLSVPVVPPTSMEENVVKPPGENEVCYSKYVPTQ